MGKLFGLNKKERLKSRKQIEALFEAGEVFVQHPLRVVYTIKPARQAGATIAVTASKKHFKKATDRNRVKRLLREAYRLQKTELVNTLLQQQLQLQVFFVYTSKSMTTFQQTKAAMQQCLKKLQTLIEKNS